MGKDRVVPVRLSEQQWLRLTAVDTAMGGSGRTAVMRAAIGLGLPLLEQQYGVEGAPVPDRPSQQVVDLDTVTERLKQKEPHPATEPSQTLTVEKQAVETIPALQPQIRRLPPGCEGWTPQKDSPLRCVCGCMLADHK